MDQRCLIMADEPELLDAVLRLAAAACVEVQRAADPADARRWWAGAPMVLLEGEAARRCAAAGLPRRDGVVLVARGEPPGWVWQAAVTVGASGLIFGWLAYLAARGIFTRNWGQIPIGLVLLVLYGGMFLTAIITTAFFGSGGISWQAHLFGAIGGVLAAALVARADGPRKKAAETPALPGMNGMNFG